MIAQAEWVAGLELSDAEREAAARSVERLQQSFRAMRDVDVEYDVPPAILFSAAPTSRGDEPPQRSVQPIESAAPLRPAKSEDLAFLPVSELAALLRTRQISSGRAHRSLSSAA